MAFDAQQLWDFIKPLLKDGKEKEAKTLISQHMDGPKDASTPLTEKKNDGLMGALGGLLGGGGSDNGGGMLGTLGGLLGGSGSDSGNGVLSKVGGLLGGGGEGGGLGKLTSLLPMLLQLIKPEHISSVTDKFSSLLGGGNGKPAPKSNDAKSTAPKAKAASSDPKPKSTVSKVDKAKTAPDKKAKTKT